MNQNLSCQKFASLISQMREVTAEVDHFSLPILTDLLTSLICSSWYVVFRFMIGLRQNLQTFPAFSQWFWQKQWKCCLLKIFHKRTWKESVQLCESQMSAEICEAFCGFLQIHDSLGFWDHPEILGGNERIPSALRSLLSDTLWGREAVLPI